VRFLNVILIVLIDYLIITFKLQTRNAINKYIYNHLMNFTITCKDIFPPLNIMYCVMGDIINETQLEKLINDKSFFVDILTSYYNLDAQKLCVLNIWPTLGQLKKCDKDQLITYFKIYRFSLNKDELNEKQLIHLFKYNMELLGYKIHTADYK